MQSETGFPSSHQLKSYVATKSRLKLAARAVLSADAGLLVYFLVFYCFIITPYLPFVANKCVHKEADNCSAECLQTCLE